MMMIRCNATLRARDYANILHCVSFFIFIFIFLSGKKNKNYEPQRPAAHYNIQSLLFEPRVPIYSSLRPSLRSSSPPFSLSLTLLSLVRIFNPTTNWFRNGVRRSSEERKIRRRLERQWRLQEIQTRYALFLCSLYYYLCFYLP